MRLYRLRCTARAGEPEARRAHRARSHLERIDPSGRPQRASVTFGRTMNHLKTPYASSGVLRSSGSSGVPVKPTNVAFFRASRIHRAPPSMKPYWAAVGLVSQHNDIRSLADRIASFLELLDSRKHDTAGGSI